MKIFKKITKKYLCVCHVCRSLQLGEGIRCPEMKLQTSTGTTSGPLQERPARSPAPSNHWLQTQHRLEPSKPQRGPQRLESLRILSLQILKVSFQVVVCRRSRFQVIINLSYSLQKRRERDTLSLGLPRPTQFK